jgi:hypothetical protein
MIHWLPYFLRYCEGIALSHISGDHNRAAGRIRNRPAEAIERVKCERHFFWIQGEQMGAHPIDRCGVISAE